VLVFAVDVHYENLVTFHVAMGGLEDQFLAVGGEIGFGILATEGQLVHVAEVLFLRRGLIGCCGLGGDGIAECN